MNLHEAGIPARLHQATWGDFDLIEAMQAVARWSSEYPERWLPPMADAESTGRGLLLHGDTGTGKTTAAALAVKDVLKHDHDAWFGSAASVESALHRQMDLSTLIRKVDEVDDETAVKFEQIMSRLDRMRMRYLVVVIDDWGRDRDSGSAFLQDFIEGTVRERFNRGLPTIITTNLTPAEIEKRFGRPWTSFMREAFIPVDFGSRDFRAAR